MDNQDVSNFSSSSPHRLPTLTASQALQNLTSSRQRTLSTGLLHLDAILQGKEAVPPSQDGFPGGLSRGQVTEIYGPPGVGKTALAMQTCVNVMRSGETVIWVDACSDLVGPRLEEMLSSNKVLDDQNIPASQSSTRSTDNFLKNFHHFTCPTLPHLVALLLHPSPSFPPESTSLIVVDSISTLFAAAFPKTNERFDMQQTPIKKIDSVQWAASRKWSVLGDFITRIGKLAAMRNLAILLTSQTTTRVRAETKAVLLPAVSSTAWDGGINSRVVLFRDWLSQDMDGSDQKQFATGARFAGVVKAGGVSYGGLGKVVPFIIKKSGLQEIKMSAEAIEANVSPLKPGPPLKRKREEIADSDSENGEVGSDEEFGWAGDEDSLAIESLTEHEPGHSVS